MEKRTLGQTGLEVSRLCFGALTIGPLQARLSPDEGGRVVRAAAEAGINFFDTAELYGTYPHLRRGLEGFPEAHVSSKSYAPDREGMQASVESALRGLGVDTISLFLCHEVDTAAGLRGHADALEYLVRARERGLVRAIGISTHSAEAVRAAALTPEIDVIHPLVNQAGLGVKGGLAAMQDALELAVATGKGLYTMKPLGGGHLRNQAREALTWCLNLPGVAAVAMGMRSVEEVALNVAWVGEVTGQGAGCEPTEIERLRRLVEQEERWLHVEGWCVGCGTCVSHCPNGALRVKGERVTVDRSRCLLCGYCGAACPDLALKIV